jgi:Predicted membrane protein
MGKRQIGQLQPFELAIAIMISELAAVPMQNTGIPLLNGIIPILTLLLAQLLISFLSLKSIKARAIICGKPSILIENGKIMENELHKEMYTLNDLLEQLRIKNVTNISDVEYAILETNGQLSVLPKSQKRPLNPEDMSLTTKYEGLALDMIVDGRIIKNNLEKANLDENWLKTELAKLGIQRIEDVFFASLDTDGNLYYQEKIKQRKLK